MRWMRPPGRVGERIAARGGAAVEILPHAEGAVLPRTPATCDALVVLGGAQDSWDDTLSSAACPHQAFQVGRASFGFQCHIEATPEIVGGWIANARDRAAAEPLKDQLGPRFDAASRAGAAIIDAWLDLVVAARDRRTGG